MHEICKLNKKLEAEIGQLPLASEPVGRAQKRQKK